MADLIVAGIGVVTDTTLNIITLDEAKRALNIALSDTSVDVELSQVVTAASRFVDSVYGPVVQREVTESFVSPSGAIWLDRPLSVTTVTEYSSGTPTVLTAEDFDTAGTYRLDATTGALARRSSWATVAWNAHEVVAVYQAGRHATTAAVDAKFKEAAVVALIHFWQHRGANSGAASFGGDGAPYGGVPFSSKQLREKLIALCPDEWTGPAVA